MSDVAVEKVASAHPPELEVERLDEPLHVTKDVRGVAASKPREKAGLIHNCPLLPLTDEMLSRESR